MLLRHPLVLSVAAFSLAASPTLAAANPAADHVLLISIDGLHAGDLARFTREHPTSALAALAASGVTYANAATTFPSDSFPGLAALLTGGRPQTTGLLYDVTWDRDLSAPGTQCQSKGTEVALDETLDIDAGKRDGGGGIDPKKLPLDAAAGCVPVYPHQRLRVNTVFEVAKAAGLPTAWSDKHFAYEWVQGPSGKGVDDLYTPEIEAGDSTADVGKTEAYDDTKVEALLHEIDGFDHTGAKAAPVPAIFGMNFQAVSVAQKNAGNGYKSVDGALSTGLAGALAHTDASLGKLTAELKAKGLAGRTVVIVTAKHGQSPIDPGKRHIVNKELLEDVVKDVGQDLLADVSADDVALLWLTDHGKTAAVVRALKAEGKDLAIAHLYSGAEAAKLFGDAATDSRAPDIVVQPKDGVIYTKPTATKLAEHGGGADDDRHVALLVSAPGLKPATVTAKVETISVAPMVLQALGLDPTALQAVKIDNTPSLPGLPF
jgi:hypothetical protein